VEEPDRQAMPNPQAGSTASRLPDQPEHRAADDVITAPGPQSGRRSAPEAIATAFSYVLANHPEAVVAAVDAVGLFVPLPPTIALNGQHVAHASSGFDLVDEADHYEIVQLWNGTLANGSSRGLVHLRSGGEATIHYFDTRETYQVLTMVLVPLDPEATAASIAAVEAPPPRLIRARKDGRAVLLDIDPEVARVLGWTREEILRVQTLEIVHPDDQVKAIAAWMEMLGMPGSTGRVRLRHRHKDGHFVWMELTNSNLLDDPDERCVRCDMLDVTAEVEAAERLRSREELLRRLTAALPVGVAHLNLGGQVVYANTRIGEILSWPAEAAPAEPFATLADPEVMAGALEQITGGEDVNLAAVDVATPGGHGWRRCTLTMRGLTDAQGAVSGAVLCLADVTEAEVLRSELEQRATIDDLTQSFNRPTVLAALGAALASGPRTTGAVFVDLDEFKEINDAHGHAAGDAMLVAAVARIRDAVRSDDVVGRMGGDEFLVVCPGITAGSELEDLAQRIAARICRAVPVGARQLPLKASVGAAWSGSLPAGSAAEDLLAAADAAMYTSKASGQCQPVLAPSTGYVQPRRTTRAVDVIPQLRQALDHGGLEVHYQPVRDLLEDRTVGYEALLRWRRGDRLVPAGEFIAAAETTGLICEMGLFVIDTVAADAATMPRDLRWFVNVSPHELAAPRTAAALRDALSRHRLDPSAVVLEITEHTALQEGSLASDAVTQLAELGADIALDDFGAGFSGLSKVLELPLSWLKLDRRLVTAAGQSEKGRALAAGVVSMADAMKLQLVAEGVETSTQLESMRELGVRFAQGYLLGRPGPLARVAEAEDPPPSPDRPGRHGQRSERQHCSTPRRVD
jgi:diguanylate cyclase (GGDEF)-like protein/PAS domain S-box-containing protein